MPTAELDLGKYMVARLIRLIETKPKTVVYSVFSKHDEDRLGTIKWFGPWRQYCFFCTDVGVFSSTCLRDIEYFLILLNVEKKKGA
jgi:hypothetical protein